MDLISKPYFKTGVYLPGLKFYSLFEKDRYDLSSPKNNKYF